MGFGFGRFEGLSCALRLTELCSPRVSKPKGLLDPKIPY